MTGAAEKRQEDIRRLIAVMRNPRYWRDRDPELLRLVELGFKKIYRRQAQSAATARKDSLEEALRLSA